MTNGKLDIIVMVVVEVDSLIRRGYREFEELGVAGVVREIELVCKFSNQPNLPFHDYKLVFSALFHILGLWNIDMASYSTWPGNSNQLDSANYSFQSP